MERVLQGMLRSFFKRVRIKDCLIQSENKDDESDNGVSGDRVHQEQREEEEDKANDQVRTYPRRITARPNYYHETSVSHFELDSKSSWKRK